MDETLLMRLPSKQKSCSVTHPLLVHGMRHDLPEATWTRSATHILLVMMRHKWWDCPEWERNRHHSPTVDNGMRHMSLTGKVMSFTPFWTWDETWLMRLPGKDITHWLLVLGWDIDETTLQRKTVSLTACWWHGMRCNGWLRLLVKTIFVEPLTYCWSWDEAWLMRLHGKERNTKSLTYCCHRRWLIMAWQKNATVTCPLLILWDCLARKNVLFLTYCLWAMRMF